MQKKFNALIKNFVPPSGYELLDYLNPVMYYKSRTKKHAIKLSYNLGKGHASTSIETESISKALKMYEILTWYIVQKTNIDLNDELDFLEADEPIKKSEGW